MSKNGIFSVTLKDKKIQVSAKKFWNVQNVTIRSGMSNTSKKIIQSSIQISAKNFGILENPPNPPFSPNGGFGGFSNTSKIVFSFLSFSMTKMSKNGVFSVTLKGKKNTNKCQKFLESLKTPQTPRTLWRRTIEKVIPRATGKQAML